ncbi:MAG: DUF1080 domain-containing protein [Planctomycetes bacterium]|nr:DUF1080 domain-containing protein [Planctomycetota bacterium]
MKDQNSKAGGRRLSRREFMATSAAGAAGLTIACAVYPAGAARDAAGAVKPSGIEGKWRVLFDGKSLAGWRNPAGGPPGKGWVLQDGAMVRKAKAGNIWTAGRYGDFILELEVKPGGNSGILLRTTNPRDYVQTGIEIQVLNSFGKEKLTRHDFGAVYDCLAPSSNALKGGPNDWQKVRVTCDDNIIKVAVNGRQVIDMDLDKWTEAHKNPDGSPNKFRTAYKDMMREGHIGLQDHGAMVAYRNIRIKPLNLTPKKSGGPSCPVCGRKGKEGELCTKCNAIITELGRFKCTRCRMGRDSGVYCPKHNRYRFNVNDDVKCPHGKSKGVWCPQCGQYACLPAVTYCSKCKKPFDRIKNNGVCPRCGTKVVPLDPKMR